MSIVSSATRPVGCHSALKNTAQATTLPWLRPEMILCGLFTGIKADLNSAGCIRIDIDEWFKSNADIEGEEPHP